MSDNAAKNIPLPFQSLMEPDGLDDFSSASDENKFMAPKRVDENGFTDESEDELANEKKNTFKSGKKVSEKVEISPAWMVKQSRDVTKSFDNMKTRLANMKKDVLKQREVESTLSSCEEMRIHFENFVNKTERWQSTAADVVNGIRHLVTTIEKDTGALELSDGVVTNDNNNSANITKRSSALPWMDNQTAAVENMCRKFQLASQKMKEKILEQEKLRSNAGTMNAWIRHGEEIDRLSSNWNKITDEAILQITTSLELAKNFEEPLDSAEAAATALSPEENHANYLRQKLKMAETLNAANIPKLAEVDKLKRNVEYFQQLFGAKTAAYKLQEEDITKFFEADLPVINEKDMESWTALADYGAVRMFDSGIVVALMILQKLDINLFSMSTYFPDNSMTVMKWRPDGVERNGVKALVTKQSNGIRVLSIENGDHVTEFRSIRNNTDWSVKRIKKNSS